MPFPGVDYLLFDSQLSEQELLVRQTARQFVDDRVMPGTLMYECCLHTLRVHLLRLGWIAEARTGVALERGDAGRALDLIGRAVRGRRSCS
mgnify:CR=1 FL=1